MSLIAYVGSYGAGIGAFEVSADGHLLIMALTARAREHIASEHAAGTL